MLWKKAKSLGFSTSRANMNSTPAPAFTAQEFNSHTTECNPADNGKGDSLKGPMNASNLSLVRNAKIPLDCFHVKM